MSENKKRLPAQEGNGGAPAGNDGNRNRNKNKKKKHYTGDRARSGGAESTVDTAAPRKDAPVPDRAARGEGRGKGGANKRRGGNGKRPQIHDGFDDIKMKPRYVTVDDEELPEDTSGEVGNAAPGVVVGRNAVRELLRSGRPVDKIYVKSGSREGSAVVIVAEAISRGIPIVEVDQGKMDRIAGCTNHQGVVAMSAGKDYATVRDILDIAAQRGEKPLIVVADGIEDPHNLGALVRCAECAGAHGIIIPKRRAVGVTPVVVKCSAGAIEHVAVARVTNLATAIEELKREGVWIFAAEAGGEAYYDSDFTVPAAIVFGSEGEGVSRLIRERSDFTVSIPMYGLVNSLNVSTAASVILCHAARVRHGKA